jgi:hypothetical protein
MALILRSRRYLQSINTPHTMTRPEGSLIYTLPVIKDPSLLATHCDMQLSGVSPLEINGDKRFGSDLKWAEYTK